ncbi:unnamed protein product [Cylicocyclus nassatus]|uniref:G-protein coupled receptors family 1 profile domain-containing protein n=1 Tax=Cylicocyclus nassatus TaxID=53992 RepID=A0AA36MAK0_CYLNA|nr:unnamed protein product [Cylicocyclus nassatus]
MSPFPSPSENVAVTAIIVMMCVLGIISNSLAIISVQCKTVRQNPFCILCSSHASAGLGVLLVYLSWVAPSTLWQNETSYRIIGKIVGHLSTVFWYATVYSHMAISINRLIAITWPLKAGDILTNQKSLCMVLFIWCISFCHTISNFWSSCYVYYSASSWEWKFASSNCGIAISYIARFNVLIVTITFLFDAVVIIKFKKMNKIMSSQSIGVLPLNSIQRRQRMEIRLYKQACIRLISAKLQTYFKFIILMFHFHRSTLWTMYGKFVTILCSCA